MSFICTSIFSLPVLLSAHAEDQRAEAKALREEVRSIHEEERDVESKKSFKISKATDSQEGIGKKGSTKSTSKPSSRSMSKDSTKDVVSNGFAHITIGKEDDSKQRTVQGLPDRSPKYEAEDKIAAEKLLQTTYREKKVNEAKKSKEGERGAMVMPRVVVEGRRHRLDSQGDSRQGKFSCK